MEKSNISSYQLFSLIVIFVLGTTVLFPVGADAKQAAWISIVLGMAGGVPSLLIYYYLNRQYPHLLLTEYCLEILGKFIGMIVSISYILFFLYGAARDVRDAMEISLLFMDETPILAIGIMLMLPVLYGLFIGIEVISRTGEIFFPYIIFSGVILILFVFFSGLPKLENLQPVLEPGWNKIIQGAITDAWMAPFGEMICFTMIFAYLYKPQKQLKVSFAGLVCGGAALVFIHLLMMAVLGESLRNGAVAPLLTMVKKISIANFIQRLDAIFMIWLIVNDYFKITIFMYAAVIGGASIFNVSKNRLILPFSIVVLATSILFAGSYNAHMAQSDIVLKHVYPVFAVYLPLLMSIICFIRQKKRQQYGKKQRSY